MSEAVQGVEVEDPYSVFIEKLNVAQPHLFLLKTEMVAQVTQWATYTGAPTALAATGVARVPPAVAAGRRFAITVADKGVGVTRRGAAA
ncbi:MAG: hypothetical protein QF515_02940 [Pseudomonadales bacterium]|nr:hypothetical protein [Pseudomonadales bacterium]